jgi:uncharacterized protein YozE (UPF0346 family)
MKTILLSASLALCLLAGASGTKEKTVTTYRTIQNFTAEFGQVDNVKWSNAMNNMTKAEFVLDDEPVCAYFDVNGDFVAETRNVTFDELPKAIRSSINNKFPGAKILNLFEMTSRQEKTWFIETVYNNERKIWKSNSFGILSRYFEKS